MNRKARIERGDGEGGIQVRPAHEGTVHVGSARNPAVVADEEFRAVVGERKGVRIGMQPRAVRVSADVGPRLSPVERAKDATGHETSTSIYDVGIGGLDDQRTTARLGSGGKAGPMCATVRRLEKAKRHGWEGVLSEDEGIES